MQQLRIHYFQHVPFEGIGSIEEWCDMHRHLLTSTKFYEDGQLPALADIDWLIVMGGPMGVGDEEEFRWLAAEKQFIKEAIRVGKTILGICLGAQLLADVLGAKVYRNNFKEIGWFPIELNPAGTKSGLFQISNKTPTVFHWHGDTFDLPNNAVNLALSAACKNQAFLLNNILGLQFHIETTEQSLKEMLKYGRHELLDAPYIQTENEILNHQYFSEQNKQMLFSLLDKLWAIPAGQP